MNSAIDLVWLLRMTHAQYLEAFRGTAIRRAKDWMLRRNAAVALGNVGDAGCVASLRLTLQSDEHPIVRGHSAWALARVAQRTHFFGIEALLREALERENDEEVCREIEFGLSALSQVARRNE
jgi:epoxyqueuosine reductase